MSVDLSDYALCSLADVRLQLGYQDDDTTRNDSIVRAINGVSNTIQKRAQRNFVVPDAWQSTSIPRYKRIDSGAVNMGEVRVGDLSAIPNEVALLSPNRDTVVVLDDGDWWMLPDVPEPEMPYETVFVTTTAVQPLVVGWWMRVKSDSWGFASIPEEIVQFAIAMSADWVLNDPLKQSERAQATGRRQALAVTIPPEFEDGIDNYRIYRVA